MIYLVEVDGNRVVVELGDGVATAVVHGRTFRIGLPAEVGPGKLQPTRALPVERAPPPQPALRGGALVAPIPGLIAEVRVAAGDVVGAGDVLVVLEAMKMRNALRAAVAGTVSAVSVAPGDAVGLGATLVSFAQR